MQQSGKNAQMPLSQDSDDHRVDDPEKDIPIMQMSTEQIIKAVRKLIALKWQ